MNAVDLQPLDDLTGCPFPFFDEPAQPDEQYYKIYHDGGSYIATRCFRSQLKRKGNSHSREAVDILFDSLYYQATKDGLKDTKLETPFTDYIKTGILKVFPYFANLDKYIEEKVKRKRHNLQVRKKRFRRKANLNCWNYFVTFTYDDNKQTPDSFRNKLRRCLSNLHTRRGWRYMGVFECAPETGRLHFHGLLYVPDGEMIGQLTEKQDYSTAQHKMQTRTENSFFEKAFGRNDFTGLSEMQLKYGHTLEYIVKYIGKTDEKIVYSRGIPTEVYKKLTEDSIITEFTDFVEKFVLFDNVVDWEEDILRYKHKKQMTSIDVLCIPPQYNIA